MNLLKTSFFSGIITAFKIFAGLITTKIMAIFVGPAGVAIVGNFNNLASLFTSFANGGISAGVTKYIAEYDEEVRKREVVKHSILINMTCSIIIGLLIILFSNIISLTFLNTLEYRIAITILGMTVVFYGFNATFTAILNGYKEIKYLLITNLIGSVISVILATIITVKFGLFGALINAMISQILIFFINIWFNKKLGLISLKSINLNVDFSFIHKLSRYSFMSIISALAGPFSILILRNYIYNNYSSNEAGYIQGMWGISAAYLMLVTTTLQIYYLPTLSSIDDKSELKKEIIHAYKLLLPITIFGALSIYLCRYYIISVMYTSEFYPMGKYFLFQVIGDVVKIASWILSFTLVAKAMTRWFIISEVVGSLSYVGFGILFMKLYGSIGITYAYTLTYIVYLIFLLGVLKKYLSSK